MPLDLPLGAFQGLVASLIGCEQRTLGKQLAEQVRKQFHDPLVGDEVVLVAIDGQGLDLGAVLDRLVYPFRKGGLVTGAAGMAGFPLRPVFRNSQPGAPLFLPLLFLWLLGLASPSLEGGLPLFLLLVFTWLSNYLILASKTAI